MQEKHSKFIITSTIVTCNSRITREQKKEHAHNGRRGKRKVCF